MLWVWIMFSSLDLVRRNINRAVSDNMVGDIQHFNGINVLIRLAGRPEHRYQVRATPMQTRTALTRTATTTLVRQSSLSASSAQNSPET